MARFKVVLNHDTVTLEVWQKRTIGDKTHDVRSNSITFSYEAARIVGQRLGSAGASQHQHLGDDQAFSGMSEDDSLFDDEKEDDKSSPTREAYERAGCKLRLETPGAFEGAYQFTGGFPCPGCMHLDLGRCPAFRVVAPAVHIKAYDQRRKIVEQILGDTSQGGKP